MKQNSDAPQADRLDLVRRVVEAIIGGLADTAAIAAKAQVAPRYALYCLHAARGLGLLSASEEDSPASATERGHRLAATPRGSEAERQVLREAFEQSPALSSIASMILSEVPPSAEVAADRLIEAQQLSVSTALRRARTLLSWRRYLVPQSQGSQLSMTFEDDLNGIEPGSNQDRGTFAADDDPSPQPEADTQAAAPPSPLPDSVDPPPATAEPTGVVAPSGKETGPPIEAEPLSENDLAYLRRHIEQGTVVLFTGAGFSASATDAQGQRLPLGSAYARELWQMCYGQEAYDDSTLQDIFEHAHRHRGNELRDSLAARFTVDGSKLPDWYRLWFSFPWSRVYTVNVDDLELAAARRFDLPRGVRSISAQTQTHGAGGADLEVVHLNGIATQGPDKVTFSVDQYSHRIARQEPLYAQLAAEIVASPFVFVGSPLEEPLLWSHIALRGTRTSDSTNESRAKSFLVSPDLPRARRDKLRAYHIIWVKGTAETFATSVLSALEQSAERGRKRIAAVRGADAHDELNIVEVSTAISDNTRRTEFLMGEEPNWSDLTSGRAVSRDEDQPRLATLLESALSPRRPTDKAPVFTISATAGAGKTTLLMRSATQLNAAGIRVAWVGSLAEVAPSAITRYYRGTDRPPVLIIDDAGRYGTELVPTLLNLITGDNIALIVLAVRSYHEHFLETPSADQLEIHREFIGPLTNADIDRLLDILEREKRLGYLRSLGIEQRRAAFRERASRQILVAMLEATLGERFEDRVVREWQGQDPIAQYIYALVSLATSQGYPLTKEEILVSCGGGGRELEALAKLKKAHLVVDEDGQHRSRHRVIAEKLLEELSQRGTQLERLVIGLCRAIAIRADSAGDRGSRRPSRVLKRLLNHDALLRLLGDIDPARSVYAALEEHLNHDYHFWLQRGCLELEAGDVRHAENFLQQAAALNLEDVLVRTALAHMQLRKAISNPTAPESGKAAEQAFETLRGLITARGNRDHHPWHVFGSQALAWSRRAALTPRARGELLREARDLVSQAVGIHRSRRELRQLEYDLRAALLQPS